MSRDIVLTSASGYTFDQIRFWLNSLDACGFSGERVVIVGNATADFVTRLEARGCTVIRRDALLNVAEGTNASYTNDDMSVDRYFLFWKFLNGRSATEIRHVIGVDMRDAVFQLDPSEWLAHHLGGKRVVVASEGLTFGDQPWNRANMCETFGPDILADMSDRLVWNCGTIAGDVAAFKSLALNLYLGCAGKQVTYSDQASLNVLLSLEPYRELTLFDHGDLGWACHAATMVAAARGPDLSYKFRGAEPLFDGDLVHTADGRPFCVVHQYDRIPMWKARLEKKFG